MPVAGHLFNQLSFITSILVVTPSDVPIKVVPSDLYNLKVQFSAPFIVVFYQAILFLDVKILYYEDILFLF